MLWRRGRRKKMVAGRALRLEQSSKILLAKLMRSLRPCTRYCSPVFLRKGPVSLHLPGSVIGWKQPVRSRALVPTS